MQSGLTGRLPRIVRDFARACFVGMKIADRPASAGLWEPAGGELGPPALGRLRVRCACLGLDEAVW
jgi:hypothetical protein